MFSIADCFSRNFDPYLVLVAAAVCGLGSYSTVAAAGRVNASRGTWLWPSLFAVCATSTVWVTHFVAMLAFRTDLPITYALVPTLLSYLVGFAFSGVTLFIAPRLPGCAEPLAYGIGLGVGIAALHYVGMSAVRVPGYLTYDPWLVIASVVLSCSLAVLTVCRLYAIRRRIDWFTTAALFATTIIVLHFMGMYAVTLQVDARVHVPPGISRSALISGTTVAGLSVALITLFGASLDKRTSRQIAREAARFRTLADGAVEGIVIHRDGHIIDMNVAARRLLHEDAPPPVQLESLFPDGQIPDSSLPGDEVEMLRADGTRVPVQIVRRPIHASDDGEAELLAIRDLTEKKLAESRLASALEDVSKLRELIPMCAWCKKIRRDNGFWNSVDEYLSRLTGNQITHGVCPECYDRMVAELRSSRESGSQIGPSQGA